MDEGGEVVVEFDEAGGEVAFVFHAEHAGLLQRDFAVGEAHQAVAGDAEAGIDAEDEHGAPSMVFR